MDFSIIDSIVLDSKSFSQPFNKQSIVNFIIDKYKLSTDRKIYYNKNISLRFSSAINGYSNTFLGFRKLLNYDKKPLIACIIREDRLEFLLANCNVQFVVLLFSLFLQSSIC